MITEHSDRARYVTEQVALWIANDRIAVDEARYCIRETKSFNDPLYMLRTHFTRQLRSVGRLYAPGVAAWHVAQELAPNDYARINWADVAAELAVSA